MWVILTMTRFADDVVQAALRSNIVAQYSQAIVQGAFRHEFVLAYALSFLILVGKPPS